MSNFINIDNISYTHASGDALFSGIKLSFSSSEKIAIVGDNGVGKTTLLKILMGDAEVSGGCIHKQATVSYVPQNLNNLSGSIAEILGIKHILDAIHKVENGDVDNSLFEIINDSWDIEERATSLFKKFNINKELNESFDILSGGEKEKILIAKAFISNANMLIFDEPTNNLDKENRELFYNLFDNYSQGIVVVTHDRDLLSRMGYIVELTSKSAKKYGGNYDFYVQCKNNEKISLENKKSFLEAETAKLLKTKVNIAEQADKSNKQGKKAVENSKISKIQGNAQKGVANSTAAKKNKALDDKIDNNQNNIYQIDLDLKDERIKIPLPLKPFIKNKILEINNLSFGYTNDILIKDLSLIMSGDDRIQIKGANGSGKSTLIKLILGHLKPVKGTVKLNGNAIYMQQDLSLLDKNKSIIENMFDFNSGISIFEAHSILANFKFRNIHAHKMVGDLSGGELLRASLSVILGTPKQPELIILDEPTNNLDIKSTEVLEETLRQYQGALIVVSHDQYFINSINIEKTITI